VTRPCPRARLHTSMVTSYIAVSANTCFLSIMPNLFPILLSWSSHAPLPVHGSKVCLMHSSISDTCCSIGRIRQATGYIGEGGWSPRGNPCRGSDAMRQAGRDNYRLTLLPQGHYGWIKPALECTRLPTNGSICKRVHIMQTLGGDAVRLTYAPAPMHAAMSTPYTAVSLTVSCPVACLG